MFLKNQNRWALHEWNSLTLPRKILCMRNINYSERFKIYFQPADFSTFDVEATIKAAGPAGRRVMDAYRELEASGDDALCMNVTCLHLLVRIACDRMANDFRDGYVIYVCNLHRSLGTCGFVVLLTVLTELSVKKNEFRF